MPESLEDKRDKYKDLYTRSFAWLESEVTRFAHIEEKAARLIQASSLLLVIYGFIIGSLFGERTFPYLELLIIWAGVNIL